jgi:hypothetical protein
MELITRKTSGTLRRAYLGVAVMIAATTIGVPSAQAGLTQATDSFDTPSQWVTWKSGGPAGMYVGPTSAARTAPNAASMLWPGGGSTADWAMIAKAFFWHSTATGGSHPAFTGCAAGVYLKGTQASVRGPIELIDTIRGTYVGTKGFSLPASSAWTFVVVSNTYACTPWLTFRIVVPNTTGVQGLRADDVVVQWYW